MDQTSTLELEATIIREAWRSELDGGRATGMQPRLRDGRIEFVHDWDLLVVEATS